MGFGILDGTYLLEGVGALLGGAGGGYVLWAAHRKTVRNRERFEDRLFGVPADPSNGTPASPGIFDLIGSLTTSVQALTESDATLQSAVTNIQEDLGEIKTLTQQLKRNGGHSLLDKVLVIDSKLSEHLTNAAKVETELHERLANFDSKQRSHGKVSPSE